jgi:hypothetical protein
MHCNHSMFNSWRCSSIFGFFVWHNEFLCKKHNAIIHFASLWSYFWQVFLRRLWKTSTPDTYSGNYPVGIGIPTKSFTQRGQLAGLILYVLQTAPSLNSWSGQKVEDMKIYGLLAQMWCALPQSQESKNSGDVGASLCAVTNDMIWRGLSSCLFSLLAAAST